MRVKGATIQNILLGLALLAGVLWNLAHAGEINDLRVSSGATGTRAEIVLDGTGEYRVTSLAGPDRLVVDLPGTRLGAKVALPAGNGLIKAVRRGQPVPGTTRIVFDLAAPVVALKPRMEQSAGGARLVLEWPGDAGAAAQPAAASNAPVSNAPAPAAQIPAAPSAASPAAAEPDPSVASSAATSRLIAGLPGAPAVSTASPASPPQPSPSGLPSSSMPSSGMPSSGMASSGTSSQQRPVPEPASPMVRAGSGTVATGVPTRIATGVPTAPPAAAAAAPEAARKPIRMAAGMRPLVIAIDAGHGGQDPGAIGPGGTYEKHVVLQIARELARQIDATPGMRAYLVRDSDVYVERPQRSRRARQAKADMFVSIHADAAQNRSAYGSSVYTLSTRGASSQHARWLADRENTSDLIGGRRVETGNTLSNVLLDLVQSGHMKASQDAARHVLDGLRDLGKAHKPNVEYANFEVLRNADMPAMLVETGFISNVDEEKRLTDRKYQARVAAAILDGVQDFFTSQPPPGTVFAARAQAASAAGGGSPP